MAALAADADLLVLDEPTSGLDPLMEQAFQQSSASGAGRPRCCCPATSSRGGGPADRVSIIRRGRTGRSPRSPVSRHTRTPVHAVTVASRPGSPRYGVADYASGRLDGQSTAGSPSTPTTLTTPSGGCTRPDPHPHGHPAQPRRAVLRTYAPGLGPHDPAEAEYPRGGP